MFAGDGLLLNKKNKFPVFQIDDTYALHLCALYYALGIRLYVSYICIEHKTAKCFLNQFLFFFIFAENHWTRNVPCHRETSKKTM